MFKEFLFITILFVYSHPLCCMESATQKTKTNDAEKAKKTIDLAFCIKDSEKPADMWDTLNIATYRKVNAVIHDIVTTHTPEQNQKDENEYYHLSFNADDNYHLSQGIVIDIRHDQPIRLLTPWGCLKRLCIRDFKEQDTLDRIHMGTWILPQPFSTFGSGDVIVTKASQYQWRSDLQAIKHAAKKGKCVWKWYTLAIYDRVAQSTGLISSLAAIITSYDDRAERIKIDKGKQR